MTAAEIIKALGGARGARGACRCPGHNDRRPSLSVRDADDGRVLVHCHAGCTQNAVIDALKGRGLWPEVSDNQNRTNRRRLPPARPAKRAPDDARRTAAALEIWRASKPAEPQSYAVEYLRRRGITIPIPPTIRSHSALKHAPTGQHFPAMVAAVQGPDRRVTAIHRTFLKHDGRAKAAVSSPKMALGPISTGAVRLGHTGDSLMLTEGIEDALALMQMTGRTAWAVIGTSGFKTFIAPECVKTIILAPDADTAGDKVVSESAARFSSMNVHVMHLRPPDGQDWCDVLGDFEERAAIAEFDGFGLRPDAEIAAFAELVGGGISDAD